MKLMKKIIISIAFGLVVLPCYAQYNGPTFGGKITKGSFYDTEKTLMSEIAPSKILKTGKYWEKNLFYTNKYRPLFMLSNKDLYDLMPRENLSVVNIINTPSVYNISFKTQSIKHISFNQPEKKAAPKLESAKTSQYEQAKNPQIDTDRKIDTALMLKDSKKQSNYVMALGLLDDVTRKEPYNAYAFYLKGELFAEQKSFENAMKNYVEALKINPYSKQTCLGIAKILEPTNKELAMKYYARAK